MGEETQAGTSSGCAFGTHRQVRHQQHPDKNHQSAKPSSSIGTRCLHALSATFSAVTFDFMVNPGRYEDFARECIYYVLISIYLLGSKRMRERFGQVMIAAAPQ